MVQVKAKAQTFEVRSPIMKQGRRDTVLAQSEGFQLRMKSYAQGGENTLHSHPNEDHTFVVLQGQAAFHDEDGNETVLGRNEGILLPRGVYYWFTSRGDEPLIMLRVGAGDGRLRRAIDGHEMKGDSEENKYVEPIVLEGAFYE